MWRRRRSRGGGRSRGSRGRAGVRRGVAGAALAGPGVVRACVAARRLKRVPGCAPPASRGGSRARVVRRMPFSRASARVLYLARSCGVMRDDAACAPARKRRTVASGGGPRDWSRCSCHGCHVLLFGVDVRLFSLTKEVMRLQGRTAKRYADTPISRPGRSHESATGMTAFPGAAEGEPCTTKLRLARGSASHRRGPRAILD